MKLLFIFVNRHSHFIVMVVNDRMYLKEKNPDKNY